MTGRSIEEVAADQAQWSESTFGTSAERGPIGVLKHLAKEVQEAQAKPDDPEEYADLLILTLDAARRAGFTLRQLIDATDAKLQINKVRTWVRSANPDEPIEHDRSKDQ